MRQMSYKERVELERKQKELRHLRDEIELEEALLQDLEGQCLNSTNVGHEKITALKEKTEEKYQNILKLKRRLKKYNEGVK